MNSSSSSSSCDNVSVSSNQYDHLQTLSQPPQYASTTNSSRSKQHSPRAVVKNTNTTTSLPANSQLLQNDIQHTKKTKKSKSIRVATDILHNEHITPTIPISNTANKTTRDSKTNSSSITPWTASVVW